jgi:CheY-like chemotaxis protein
MSDTGGVGSRTSRSLRSESCSSPWKLKVWAETVETERMKRILVVDDEPSVLMAICNNLRGRRAEWEPVLALDADEACMRLDAAADINALVCDLAMPGGGGIRVLRHAAAKYPHVARIVLSGKSRAEVESDVMPLCERYLEKPCSALVLRQTIQWAIDRSSGTAT